MWYPATVTAAPTSELVSLDAVKGHLYIDSGDQDAELSVYITAARQHLEDRIGQRIGSQTITVKCDAFTDFAYFPEAPVTSVSSVTYVDTDGVTQTLSGTVYELRTDGPVVSIALKYNQVWPAIQPRSRITVTAVVGFTATTVPSPLISAIMTHVGALYEHRESAAMGTTVTELPQVYYNLICNYQRF